MILSFKDKELEKCWKAGKCTKVRPDLVRRVLMNITERKPFTPGEILKEEFMDPYGLTQQVLAEKIGVPRARINEIINSKRIITPDTAWRLAQLFKMSPEYWLNLQMKNDLWIEMHNQKKQKEILQIKPIKTSVLKNHHRHNAT